MITPLFPTNFFSLTKLPNTEHNVKLLETAELDDDQNFSWCGEDDGRNNKVERLKESTVMTIIAPVINSFLEELGCAKCGITLQDVWRNTYSYGGYQEIHQHKPSVFSAVIFLDDYEEGGSVFSFLNTELRTLPDSLLRLMPHVSESLALTPNRGDIIIFPSYMYHEVSKHRSEKTRRTVACNIYLN